jgi:hypothetical protein
VTAREILVPFSHRALLEGRREELVAVLSVEAAAAADAQGWELPADLAPTIVDSYIDAEELSDWTLHRIEQARDELGEEQLSDLAFAYWEWEHTP